MQLRHRVEPSIQKDRFEIALADAAGADETECLTVEIALADKAAPEWIQLIPVGEFMHADFKQPFVLKNAADVISRSMASGRPLPIDYDHAIDRLKDTGASGRAAGWITEIDARDGALWARVEWTENGAAAIANREYRFLSPVYGYDKTSREIGIVFRAALTNNPALTMTAIADRQGNKEEDTMTVEQRKKLCASLGLKEDASDEAIVVAAAAATTGLTNLRTAIADKLGLKEADEKTDLVGELTKSLADKGGSGPDERDEAIKTLQSEVNELKSSNAKGAAEVAVADAVKAGKISPSLKEWAIGYASKDPAGFADYVEKQPAILDASGKPLTENTPPPAGELTADEKVACASMGISEDEFKKSKKGFGQ